MALADKNLYAYCDNNPVVRADEDGHFWNFIVGAVVGAVVGAAVSVVSQAIENHGDFSKIDLGKVGVDAVCGAASGLLAASGVGLGLMFAGNAAISMAGNASKQGMDITSGKKSSFNVGDMMVDGVIGGVAGMVGGRGMGKAVNLKTLNSNLTKKVLSGSAKTAIKGAKYYVSQTSTIYYRNLFKPIVYRSGSAALGMFSAKSFYSW